MTARDGRRAVAIAFAVIVMAMSLGSSPSVAQQHGTSLYNVANEVTVVGAGARDPSGLAPAPGHVLVRDVVDLENPTTAPFDYGISYVPPEFGVLTGYPKVLSFSRDYTVANYTLVLTNASASFVMAVTGLRALGYTLPASQVHPDGPGEPHPRANSTYAWSVVAVEARGFNVTVDEGGNVTPREGVGTVFTFAGLGLPSIGAHHDAADAATLANLTARAYLEPQSQLTAGFYRFRITDMSFEPGVNLTVELRYATMAGSSGEAQLKELYFTERPVSLKVFARGGLKVTLLSEADAVETVVPPISSQVDPASGTVQVTYVTTTSFRLAIEKAAAKGTDWGMIARYGALVSIMAVLIAIILYPGRRKEAGSSDVSSLKEEARRKEETRPIEGTGEEEEAREEGDGPDATGPTTDAESRRRELLADKDALVQAIRKLDEDHAEGRVPEAAWKELRAGYKARTIDLMKELDALQKGS